MHVEPYVGLAALYNTIGLAAYSEALIPRLLEMAFISGWVGRTIIDIGCGTGEVVRYLGQQSYRIIGCDSSTAMLTIAAARAQSEGLNIEWLHGTAQMLEMTASVDLALMLGGTINLLGGLNDIDQAMQRVAATLEPGKLFIFDMDTVRGLIDVEVSAAHILYNMPDQAFVAAASQISYEQLTRTTEITIFNHKLSDNSWLTFTETHIQRALPFSAIKRYLNKAGFTLISVLDPQNMSPADPEDAARILVVAQKQAAVT